MAAERTTSRRAAVVRVSSGLRELESSRWLFACATTFSTCGDKRDSRANQYHPDPAGRAYILAQNIFRAQGAHYIAQRRSWNHEADRLPGEQHQQRIEGECHQRHARPEPAVTQRAPKEGQQFSWAQARRLPGSLHPEGYGDFAARSAEDQHPQKQRHTNHAATSRTATSVVRGRVWLTSSTPTQIRMTPTHRRGDTASCRNVTANKVSVA